MYQGSPCKDMYPTEYFPHGITNGAQWYNVPGEVAAGPLVPFTCPLTHAQLKDFSLVSHKPCTGQPGLLRVLL